MVERSEQDAPTIRDVAIAAGVSGATVSRAFNRPEMLRPETVQHVQNVAERLGYTPNLVARALSTGRHGNVALIVPHIANPFIPPLVRAAQQAADRVGRCMFLGDSDEDPGREDLLVAKFVLQVEGIVLAAPRLSEERIREHVARRPLILVNRDIAGIPRVLIESTRGVRAAVEHLADLGHRRLAYVSGPTASWSNRERRRAVRQACTRLGLELVVVPSRQPTYDAGVRSADAILATDATGVIAFDDVLAQGIVTGLRERGRSVPADLSVVGCDDVLPATMGPRMTTVHGSISAAGRRAVELLLADIESGQRSDVRDLIDTRLVVRDTTGPAASR